MENKPLVQKSFRVDEDKYKAVLKKNVNIGDAIRGLLDNILKTNECPTCGAKLKTPKNR